jgi:hypothetical protein
VKTVYPSDPKRVPNYYAKTDVRETWKRFGWVPIKEQK